MRIDFAATCCMLVDRQSFEMVGYMDERYFVYYDDTDFCYRAARSGLTMFYLPQPIIRHKVSSLTQGPDSPFTIRFGVRNRIYYTRKHFQSVVGWLFIQAYRLATLARLVVGKDNQTTYGIRVKAFIEGQHMDIKKP